MKHMSKLKLNLCVDDRVVVRLDVLMKQVGCV